MTRKRVLITAANGMGPFVIKAFQEAGYEVFCIARNDSRKLSALARSPNLPASHVLTCDLATDTARDSAFWQKIIADYKIDGVVNNAMVTPKNSITKPGDRDQTRTHRVNTDMAAALFAACAKSGIPVIQQSTHRAHVPNDKHDIYRKSKDAARRKLQALVKTSGLRGVVVEPGMVTVPGEGHYRMELLAGLPFRLKLFQKPGTLQPLDIDDLTTAMVGMMQNLHEDRRDRITPGVVYQAAGPTLMRLPQYLGAIREAIGIAHRRQLTMPMPLTLAQKFMRVASKMPFMGMLPFDYFDTQELQRDFEVKKTDLAAFMKAGNLATLRDPIETFREYARNNAPYSRLGALFAMAGFDIERWVKSLRHEKQSAPSSHTADVPRAEPEKAAAQERRRVLVTGATGFIGPLIVQELLAAGHEVICTIRSPEKAARDLPYPGLTFIAADMNRDLDPALWKRRLAENRIDAVINNAGIEQSFPGHDIGNINIRAAVALAEACRDVRQAPGAGPRFIQISSGLLTARNADSFAYARSKKEVEQALLRMSGLDWVSVRPNYVYEPGRGHVLFEELAKLPALAFVKDGPKQPISNRDLALGLARLVTANASVSGRILEAAGTETLGWRAMLQHVSEATRESLKIMPRIPRALAVGMTGLNQTLPKPLLKKIAPYIKIDAKTLQHVSPEIFRMLCAETHSDPAEWIRHTGVTPSSISEVYRAWHAGPAHYAALYDGKRAQRKASRPHGPAI